MRVPPDLTTAGLAVPPTLLPDPGLTTADDGYVMVDSDLFGAEENYAASWVENRWFTIDDLVDFTGHPFVTVEFENRYRCWDNTTDIERCYLEVSPGWCQLAQPRDPRRGGGLRGHRR